MLRSEFSDTADAYIHSHPDKGWTWHDHPSGYGYMARSCQHTRRSAVEPDAETDGDDATAATPAETLTCKQYVVYSATFQVPAFYFTLHDAGGSPLALDHLVCTTLFHRFAFEGTESTSFGVSLPGSAFPLLSQGDHPTLGTPCWHFHPCESATAVDEVMTELGEQRTLRWLETWFMVLGQVVSM
ncbi:hypothetical protein K438DRAFT_1663590 [Mycena galopus ATCC 62051]|nr:hypothetical protein K438DRAFT_1663590 [Mycena galopus ATCC 62051]